LIDLHEFLVPFLDVCGLLAGIGVIVTDWGDIILVVLAPFDDLLQDRFIDLWLNVSTRAKVRWVMVSLRWGWGRRWWLPLRDHRSCS
jgi:hypothetical protein